MDNPKMRNEFGLDGENALDVQKERIKPRMPWAIGLGALVLIVCAGLIYAFSMGPNNHTTPSAAKPPPQTTGSR